MKKRADIKEEVQKTMQSWDDLQGLPENPYLYTRIKDRMSTRNVSSGAKGNIWAWALAGLLILFNVWSVVRYANRINQPQTNPMEQFAQEYGLDVENSLYNGFSENK